MRSLVRTHLSPQALFSAGGGKRNPRRVRRVKLHGKSLSQPCEGEVWRAETWGRCPQCHTVKRCLHRLPVCLTFILSPIVLLHRFFSLFKLSARNLPRNRGEGAVRCRTSGSGAGVPVQHQEGPQREQERGQQLQGQGGFVGARARCGAGRDVGQRCGEQGTPVQGCHLRTPRVTLHWATATAGRQARLGPLWAGQIQGSGATAVTFGGGTGGSLLVTPGLQRAEPETQLSLPGTAAQTRNTARPEMLG